MTAQTDLQHLLSDAEIMVRTTGTGPDVPLHVVDATSKVFPYARVRFAGIKPNDPANNRMAFTIHMMLPQNSHIEETCRKVWRLLEASEGWSPQDCAADDELPLSPEAPVLASILVASDRRLSDE